MKTIVAAAAAMIFSFVWFVVHIYWFHTDYDNQFEKFKQKYFPSKEERKAAGQQKMATEFKYNILGYYFCAALTLYGFIFLLETIIERWKN